MRRTTFTSAVGLLAAVVLLVGAGLAAGNVWAGSSVTQGSAKQFRSGFAWVHGLVYGGLRRARRGPCRSLYRLAVPGAVRCTHGPDPSPPGIAVHRRRPLAELRATFGRSGGHAKAAAAPSVPCVGDGTSGDRVEAVYAHPPFTPDHYDSIAPLIRQWAAQVEETYERSAAETGGARQVRFVTDSACQLVVRDVVARADTAAHTFTDLAIRGFTAHDRKYLIWMDANVLCGMGETYPDATSWSSNRNDGPVGTPAMMARIDEGCWGLYETHGSVEAHELTHTLGAVLRNAPHATKYGHCTDRYDAMCYVDGPGTVLHDACPISHQQLLDCNHDDYFSTKPARASWLATHWNAANNAFLVGGRAPAPPPPPPAPKCTVPRVTGKLVSRAVSRIVDARCSLAKLTSAYSRTVGLGRVISQAPRAGTVLPAGANVALVFSRGAPPPPRPTHCVVPAVKRLKFATAYAKIIAAGCRPKPKMAYSAKIRVGRVVSQAPRPGKVLRLHAGVRVVISRGRKPKAHRQLRSGAERSVKSSLRLESVSRRDR